MDYELVLKNFHVNEPLADEVIEANTDPLFDGPDEDVFKLVASYMAWCLRHGQSDGNIIIDGTIAALSELGRTKTPYDEAHAFKYKCTILQRTTIIQFLEWCIEIDYMHPEFVERALKHWRKSVNIRFQGTANTRRP